MTRKYSGLPEGIKLSTDLKEFREFALLEFLSRNSDPICLSEFEKVFSAYCKHKTSTQAEKLKSIAERI